MIEVTKDLPLYKHTTMNIGGAAENLCLVKTENELIEALTYAEENQLEVFILGEGSNIVVSDDGIKGLVIKFDNADYHIVNEDEQTVKVAVSAGFDWDDFVALTVQKKWWGIENMSLIPGTVGACPVQNVGAYGQQCRDVIVEVRAYDKKSGEFVQLANEECQFGFRESIFNRSQKNRYVITQVIFLLSKVAKPCLLRKEVANWVKGSSNETLQQNIRDKIIEMRSNGKSLPYPNSLGNSGTFFRTAIVKPIQVPPIFFKTLFKLGPKNALAIMAFGWRYRSPDGFKLPSRYLINACKLSSSEFNNIKLYPTNSAVLTSEEGVVAHSDDVLKMIKHVRVAVYKLTGVVIPVEPTLVGFSKIELDSTFDLSSKL